MIAKRLTRGVTAGVVSLLVIMGCAAIAASTAETPGKRFRKAMKELSERCAKEKIALGNTMCDPLKLKPADPLATPEGRFAHSLKIPNPVPEDSGYKSGMTPQEYFDHLCKAEAGEFIYKTAENVEGIYQMRPRERATDYMLQDLYALEDPYGPVYGQEFNIGPDALKAGTIQSGFVNPAYSQYVRDKSEKGYKLYKPDQSYKFLEKSIPTHLQSSTDGDKYLRYTRPNTDKLVVEDGQYFYPRDLQPKMIEERVKELKSRYGFTWRGINRFHDRELGIAGGELIVLDVQTNEVLGVRRGYLRTANVRETGGRVWWLGARACPSNLPGVDNAFIYKVLKPSKSIN